MEDWYRATSWNEAIALDFEKRLRRSRSQKAQYLRIQGMTLGNSCPEVAIALLSRCANMQDDDSTAPALACIGGILLKQGQIDRAIDALNRATAQQERVPEVATNAPADFCFLVTFHNKVALYDRAWAILQWLAPLEFGAAGYARNGAMAVILAHRGDATAAAFHAQKALQSALDKNTPLPGGVTPHPDAVVRQIDNPFTARLIAIQSAGKGN